MNHCWYVTDRWTIHDERWIAALATQEFEPHVLSLSRDELSLEEVCNEIRQNDQDWPVLAGPLTTVTSELADLPNRIIGLSWGFDLLDARAEDATWLTQLDHLIVDSVATKSIAINAGLSEKRISLIPWGIDVHLFTLEGSRADLESYGVLPSQLAVLSLRAHEPLYRVEDFIEAWPLVLKSYPHAVALIGNAGSLTPDLKRSAEASGVSDRIRFIGTLEESELPHLLRAVSAYVSTSPIDGTSVTMLQAMACGAPVITTDTEGNRDWITPNVSGTLVTAGDPEALAKAITRVLSEHDSPHQHEERRNAYSRVNARADWTRNVGLLGSVMRVAK